MKKSHLFLALFLLAISFQSAFTQLKDSSANNSLLKHKFALQYETGYDFTSGSMDPITFLLKFHLSDRSALRLGFGVNGSSMHGRSHKHYDNDTLPRYEHFGKIKDQYALTMSYLFYPAPKADINLFFGAGARYGFSDYHHERPFPYGPDTAYYQEGKGNNAWSLGVTGIFGAEWFATRSISFFTEYNASFVYQNIDERMMEGAPPPRPEDKEEKSKFRFADISARAGLSIYFNYPF